MSGLAGTGALVRFGVRRAWLRMLVWVGATVGLLLASASSVQGLYGSPEQLAQIAQVSKDNAAAIVFNGPAQALDTLGGQIAFQVGTFGLIVMALMSTFLLGHLTRVEEENGRTDLLLATTVGRHAPLAAGIIVVVAVNVLVGAGMTAGLLLYDLPTAGCLSFGVSFLANGLVFTGITAVAAQITENTRVVYGTATALVGAAFILRAIGDIGDGTVSWLSPIGWSQKMRPFAEENWWALAVPLAVTAVLLVAAALLAARRDVGAGLVAPRPGRASASGLLASPVGLAVRLQRGSLVAWAVGLAVLGIAYGSVANMVNEFIQDNEQMAKLMAMTGQGSLTDQFLATTTMVLALVGSGFAVQSVLRLSGEEGAARTELLLATPTSRSGWVLSHLLTAVVGASMVLAVAGVGNAVTYGLVAGDFSAAPRIMLAAVVYLPAVWVLAGVAVALFGLVPRLALAAWGAYALVFLAGFLGDLLNLPSWVKGISPFEHTPRLPVADLRPLPLIALLAVAAALMAAGLAGFRRRDTPR